MRATVRSSVSSPTIARMADSGVMRSVLMLPPVSCLDCVCECSRDPAGINAQAQLRRRQLSRRRARAYAARVDRQRERLTDEQRDAIIAAKDRKLSGREVSERAAQGLDDLEPFDVSAQHV